MKSLGDYIDELRSLDQNNIGSWPTWAYGLAMSMVAIVIVLLAGWYFVLPARDTLVEARAHEAQLKTEYRERAVKVANLAAYRDQLRQMNTEYANLLAQLPSRTEVPSLLRDISEARAANSLNEELFKPEPEVVEDFYAELPNDLTVTGDFHHFARFVSDVAALPRIVTIHDIQIAPVITPPRDGDNPADTDPRLRMSLVAKTYRYRDHPDKLTPNIAPARQSR